ncbi:MAG: glycosyl hydrolase family 18 protein, partial [Clostridium sp.]
MSKRSLNKIFNTLIAAGVLTSMFVTTAVPVKAAQNVIDTPTTQAATQSQKRSIGYYADWSMYDGEGNCNPNNVPADKLTHLNVAFNGLTKDGHLRMLDKDANFGHPLKNAGVTYGDIGGGIVNDLQNVRAKNPNLKLGFSLGGWSLSGIFTHVARNDAARKTMAKEVAELLDYTNFDFIDLDWEYPADVRPADNVDLKNDEGNPDAIPEDKQNYVLLLKEIRSELNKLSLKTGKKYEISIAIGMSHYKTQIGIDVPKIFEIIDFANVMTYDANGAWSAVSGHQTALYDNPNDPMAGQGFTVDSSIKNFLKLGAPPEKLVVGAAFYTRGWEKVNNDGPDAKLPGLFGNAQKINKDIDLALGYGAKNDKPLAQGDGGRNAGNWAWRNRDLLHKAYPGLVEYWDDTAKAPYLYNKDTGAFFTYDNKQSIGEKTKYVNANNLGGIITWMASNDKQTASGKNDDLTSAIYSGLFGTTQLPKYDIKNPTVNASAVLTAQQNSWEKTGLLNIQLKNDMKLTSSGSLMVKTAEEAADTLKYMKMYIKTSNGLAITGGESPSPTPTLQNGYYVLDFGSSYDM